MKSSFLQFVELVRGKGFKRSYLRKLFNKKVEKSDYAKEDKKEILGWMYISFGE